MPGQYFPRLFSLEGRVVLVTGAASGLGRAMAFGLAEAGAALVAADRDAAGLDTQEHHYYLPPAAAASWDRWDNRWARRILNRPLYSWIGSRKLRRVVPPGFWYKLFMPWLIPPYERALREQEDPSAIGASLYLRAVRR